MTTTDQILIGAAGSIIATILVLLTRLAFYKIRDMFPARALFEDIVGSDRPCLVFVLRMTDLGQEGRFLTPLPKYAITSTQPSFERRQLTPWVTSTSETQSVANILNVLGRAGKTENIQLAYVDQDYDKWDSPMFILGGSWKARRALETCDPYFAFRDGQFIFKPTEENYEPKTADHDLGLLHKMINPSTGFPIWVAMGWRGAGTIAATGALARWWKQLGFLYGSKCFAILVEMNDQDGWQQFRIIRLYPAPAWCRKVIHPLAWRTLQRAFS